MMLAPIILFVYNRPEHTKKVLDALAANHLASDSDLFIYADGVKPNADKILAEKVERVRQIIRSESRFNNVHIIESPVNKGLAKSVIGGVTEVITQYNKAIILEDDLIASEFFLRFMNDALNKFESAEEVVCISGYSYPVKKNVPELYFIKGADCWGWATWKRGWNIFEEKGEPLLKAIKERQLENNFNFFGTYPYTQMLQDQINGKNDSWAIRWYASAFIKDKLTLYPGKSFIQNIGFDGTGTHSGNLRPSETAFDKAYHADFNIVIGEDTHTKRIISSYFYQNSKTRWLRKLKTGIRQLIGRYIQ